MSSADTDTDTGVPGYSRKRQRNVENWKKTKLKQARDRGKSYISRNNNQSIPARALGPACKCGCFEKLGRDKVQEFFDNFWAIGNFDHQNAYLSKLVTSVEVKDSRVKDRPSRTTRSIKYTVKYDNKVYSMCRTGFYSTHGITERRVRTVLEKQSSTGVTGLDKRGHNVPHNKMTQERMHSSIDHINSVPKVSSHYSRASSPHRKYLPPGLNINTMYTMYLDWLTASGNGIQPVSNYYYRYMFNKYNIGFEPPRMDTCNTCDLINNKIKGLSAGTDGDEIVRLQEKKMVHLAESKDVQNILKQCKLIDDPAVAALCFDLQQTLPTPKLSTGMQYYKRKLWCYNLCIHDIKTGKAVMYLWNETQGRRGSAEISSCLRHYLTHTLNVNVKILKLFSDNCPGQNKNINLVLTSLRYIHDGRFNKIDFFLWSLVTHIYHVIETLAILRKK